MITYKLLRMPASDGRTSLNLYLYAGAELARIATIATVDPLVAVKIFVEAQMHLRKLGIGPASKANLLQAA